MTRFAGRELKEHNGKEGKPAYVAVDGEVYDVSASRMWKNGTHMAAHSAGFDLTGAIEAAPHGREVLRRFTHVGQLEQEKSEEEMADVKAHPAWASVLIALHAHPVTAHFPQAFFTFAPLFLVLFYLTGNGSFERTAYHLMVAGFIMAFPAVITGFIHWWYKFSRRSRPVFRLKTGLSLLLLALGGFVLGSHTFSGVLETTPVNWVVLILYCAQAMIAVFLGKAGGMIVFEGKGR
ncbi:MAG TPA: DUF2231 domain-containing protein [Acidobacteriota bacterium]|nr:DUF2231 domain-containing protein [Acidobacteriota bacterium]